MDKELVRYDRGQFKGSAKRTDEGYVRAEACVTRTGVFVYQNADGTTRRELRHPDDVFEKKSIDSMKMIPITNGHPNQKLVNADNAKELSIGHTGENIYIDGKYVMSPLVVTNKDGVESIDMGKKELSLGYTVDLEKVDGEYNGERYDHRQRNIQYNHLAIVDRARAGSAARIHLDSSDAVQTEIETEPKEKEPKMDNLKTVSLDGIEYKAAPEVVNALTKSNGRADEAEKSLKEVQTKLDSTTKELETVKADRDSLKEKAETKTDAAEIQKAVKERLSIERTAQKALKADALKKLDEMSNKDVMIAVVKEKAPKANLDGASDDYIKARFDGIAEELVDQKGIDNQRQKIGERADGGEQKADAASEAFDALKNMHKKEGK